MTIPLDNQPALMESGSAALARLQREVNAEIKVLCEQGLTIAEMFDALTPAYPHLTMDAIERLARQVDQIPLEDRVEEMHTAGLSPREMVRRLRGVSLRRVQSALKALARERTREAVYPHIAPMVEAQVAQARGMKYLVYRDQKTGRFERVKNIDDVDQSVETIEVWEKDPSTQAFVAVMDRAIDKPTEHHEVTGEDGDPIRITLEARIAAARARVGDDD